MFKFISAAAISLAWVLTNSSAHAENVSPFGLKFDKSRVYIATIAFNEFTFTTAKFCPVSSSGEFNFCRRKDGYGFGIGFQTRKSDRTDPNFILTSSKYTVSSRVALASGSEGNHKLRIDDITYFFDARPGTVFVLGPPNRMPKWTIAQARQIFVEQFGENFGQLSYVHMSAAKVDCPETPNRQSKCKLGKQVDLSGVHKRYRQSS